MPIASHLAQTSQFLVLHLMLAQDTFPIKAKEAAKNMRSRRESPHIYEWCVLHIPLILHHKCTMMVVDNTNELLSALPICKHCHWQWQWSNVSITPAHRTFKPHCHPETKNWMSLRYHSVQLLCCFHVTCCKI
jgi:hypothetical protein